MKYLKLLMIYSKHDFDNSRILYFLAQVSIIFADTEAIKLDECASVRHTGISHDERPTSSTSGKGDKVAEKTSWYVTCYTHIYVNVIIPPNYIVLMKKYLWYLKQLHNTAFTLIIIPGIESTASAQSADAISISPPLQQSTVDASSTANT